MTERMRIDKWLWAARFYKTRSLAADEVGRGRVQINGQDAKPGREIKPGDTVHIRQAELQRTVLVRGLSLQRGPAPVAQQLYAETEESLAARTLAAERRHFAREPAHSIEHGRPTKRDRREIARTWDDRWSASVDPD